MRLDAGARAGRAEAGLRARLRQHGRRPGRAGLRRRLDGRRAPTATLLARAAAVRRASCSSSTSTCRARPRSTATGAGRAACDRAHVDLGDEPAARRTRRAGAGDRRAGSTTRPRSTARSSLGLRDYVAQERLPRRWCSACPAASTRRWSRRSPATRSAPDERARRLDARAATPREHSTDDAADLAERTGLHYRTVPIAPMVDAFLGALDADRARRGEPAGPGARRRS